MKRLLMLALAALMVLSLAACAKNPTEAPAILDEGDNATAAPAASATPDPSATPEVSPSPSITPTPVPGPSDAPATAVNSGEIADLAENCDIVVLGQFTEDKGIWNAARDPEDPTKESDKHYIGEKQYSFQISAVYQGSKLVSKGDTIVVTLPYEAKMDGWAAAEPDITFIEPTLNQDTMLFLCKDRDFDIWYFNTDPYTFTVTGEALFVKSADPSTEKTWADKYPNGISLDSVKKDLGI